MTNIYSLKTINNMTYHKKIKVHALIKFLNVKFICLYERI